MRCCNSSLQSKLFVMFLGNISPCFHYWNARSWVSLHRWVSLIPLASHQRIRRGGCGGASWWATAWSQESAWRHILWDRQSAISYSLFWTSNSSSQIWCEDSSYDFYNAMISASDGASRFNTRPKGGLKVPPTGFKSYLHCLTRPWGLADDWKYLAKGSQIKRSDCKFIHLMLLDRSMCMDCECVVWWSLQKMSRTKSSCFNMGTHIPLRAVPDAGNFLRIPCVWIETWPRGHDGVLAVSGSQRVLVGLSGLIELGI